jgi:hypothetical protein
MRLTSLAMVLLPLQALAQLSAADMPVSVTPPTGVAPVRWVDVSWGGGAFLAVSGEVNVMGQLFAPDGSATGSAFVVNSDMLYAQAPRAAFSANAGAWLVTWHATQPSNAVLVRGRLIRNGQPPLASDFDISPTGSNWEMGAAVAWSSTQHEFLVAWQDFGATLVKAQRVSEAGALVGGVITVDTTAGYERDPGVGYDPDDNRYLVAYGGCVGNNDCFVRAQFFDAASGAPVGSVLSLDAPIMAGYIPELAWNAITRRFLCVWYRPGQMVARTVAPDGTLGAQVIVSTMYSAYDANSVAWNPLSNTYVMVTHSTTSQDAAIELDPDGNPLDAPGLLIEPATANGNFNPRIAASGSGPDWLAVTSSAFATLSAQRLTTGTRLGPGSDAGSVEDAGSGGDAGTQSDAGMQSDAGSGDGGNPSAPDGGARDGGSADGGNMGGSTGTPCGCASGPSSALLLAVLALVRRDRRGARTATRATRSPAS